MKRKLLLLILAALTILSAAVFASCGSGSGLTGPDSEKLVGKWLRVYPYRDMIEGYFEYSLELTVDLSGTEDLCVREILEFTPDGKISLRLDEEASNSDLEKFLNIVEERLYSALEDEIKTLNIEISVDDYLKEAEIGSFGKLMNYVKEDLTFANIIGDYYEAVEYSYSAKDGRLYSYEGVIDTDCYETYVLDGDTLTFTGSVGFENSGSPEEEDYPAVYTRIN